MSGGDSSWLVLDTGTAVLSSDGAAVGRVSRVLGDESVDIFHGLSISPAGGGLDRFVPAARVTAIWIDRVELDVPEQGIALLDEISEEKLPRVEGVSDHVMRRLLWPYH